MASTPEGAVKTKIQRFLKLHSIPHWHIIPSALGNSTGISDVLAILRNGTMLAIEAKAPGKKANVTANQQKFLDTVNINGGHAVVVDSDADLIELESWLRYRELI